jgi:phosphoribosylformylglycinamidine synthase
LSARGATIELEKDLNRVDNLLFAEGGSRIIFSISKIKQNEWFNYLKQNQIKFPSSVYVKKIGYVSADLLNIKIDKKNICNIRVEELSEKFNNSISDYF